MGTNIKYVHESVRGDLMGWFNGIEAEEGYAFKHLPVLGRKVRVLVTGLVRPLLFP